MECEEAAEDQGRVGHKRSWSEVQVKQEPQEEEAVVVEDPLPRRRRLKVVYFTNADGNPIPWFQVRAKRPKREEGRSRPKHVPRGPKVVYVMGADRVPRRLREEDLGDYDLLEDDPRLSTLPRFILGDDGLVRRLKAAMLPSLPGYIEYPDDDPIYKPQSLEEVYFLGYTWM